MWVHGDTLLEQIITIESTRSVLYYTQCNLLYTILYCKFWISVVINLLQKSTTAIFSNSGQILDLSGEIMVTHVWKLLMESGIVVVKIYYIARYYYFLGFVETWTVAKRSPDAVLERSVSWRQGSLSPVCICVCMYLCV